MANGCAEGRRRSAPGSQACFLSRETVIAAVVIMAVLTAAGVPGPMVSTHPVKVVLLLLVCT